jgi:hypothetical protein
MLPQAWAHEEGTHHILRRESGGWVGRPNYTYAKRRGADIHKPSRSAEWPEIWAELRAGRIRARSSATGLGQLLLSNMDRYAPAGRLGIGDALQEAVAFLRYIEGRYTTPVNAWEFYEMPHCDDGTRSWYSDQALAVGCKPGEGY